MAVFIFLPTFSDDVCDANLPGVIAVKLHFLSGVTHKESGDAEVNAARQLDHAPAAATEAGSVRRARFLAPHPKGWNSQ